MSKVMVLPATVWQVALITRLKELGHEVHLVNPTRNPGVCELADHFFASDIFEVDEIERYARQQGIEAVLSDECDIAMPVVAELGARLNISTLSKEAAALFTDKSLMREFAHDHGMKSVAYKVCQKVEDAVAFLKEMGRPIVIKPLDSNASHGVFKVSTEEELRERFDEAWSFSRARKAVLAERYIAGTEFTVDGIKTPNGHYTLAISEKKHFKHNVNVARELYFTHSHPDFDYGQLKAVNDSFVLASPLQYGFTHAEYKCEDGEFYLIEIGARGGGNMISSVITRFMAGHDTYRYLIDCALGNIREADFSIDAEHARRAAVLEFFMTPENGGRVKEIRGLDYLEREERIKAHKLNFNVGDVIQNAKNDSDRIGFYIACADDRERLDEVMEKVEGTFEIILAPCGSGDALDQRNDRGAHGDGRRTDG